MTESTAFAKSETLFAPPAVDVGLLDDLFDRQDRIPGTRRDVLAQARIMLIGAGGLNSWVGLALLRSGATNLTIVDDDLVECSNLPRQLYTTVDAGKPKASCLIRNLVPHALSGARLSAQPVRFEEALQAGKIEADLLVCGVDNNACRIACVREARSKGIPAVFTMLSEDGMYCQIFLQGSKPDDPCLFCAVPHQDTDLVMPCVAAGITGCMLACPHTVNFVHRTLMGWPAGVQPFNWREADLLGRYPDRTGQIRRRDDCPICHTS